MKTFLQGFSTIGYEIKIANVD